MTRAARKPYTPQAVQNRVLEEHLSGKSNRKIAKITGRDRGIVSRILSQPDIVEFRNKQWSRLFQMAPKSVSVMKLALKSDDLRLAVPVAIKVAEATGILPKDKKAIELPQPERDTESGVNAVMGQMLRVTIDKSSQYSTPIPASIIEQLPWMISYLKKALEDHQNRQMAKKD